MLCLQSIHPSPGLKMQPPPQGLWSDFGGAEGRRGRGRTVGGPQGAPGPSARSSSDVRLCEMASKQGTAAQLESEVFVRQMGEAELGAAAPPRPVPGASRTSRAQLQEQEPAGGKEGSSATSGGCVTSLAPISGGSSCPGSLWKSLQPLGVPTPTLQDGTKQSAAFAFGEHFQIPSFVISFLGKKTKFSQTSWEAHAFTIRRFSGLKAQWVKDARS